MAKKEDSVDGGEVELASRGGGNGGMTHREVTMMRKKRQNAQAKRDKHKWGEDSNGREKEGVMDGEKGLTREGYERGEAHSNMKRRLREVRRKM